VNWGRGGHIALTDCFGENLLKKAQFPKNRTYVDCRDNMDYESAEVQRRR
jgi:hypothetical protein